MARRTAQSESELREVLLETYSANDAMNQLLLAHIDPRAWRSSPGQENRWEGRTIAGIFSHLHNNRLVWIKNSAPHLKCPAPPDPARCTIKQARAAHRKSAARCLEMLTEALSAGTPRRVTKFSRAVGHQHGLPEQPCSATCLRTRHIIVARQSCSPANWATGYQTRPHMASGAGRNFGRSVGLRRARDEAKAIHRSLQNSRCHKSSIQTFVF